MNRHECAIRGETAPAVVTCRHSGAGGCLEHLRDVQAHCVGGTTLGCPHSR